MQQYLPMYNDLEEDLGYVKLIEMGALIPPKSPQGTKFDIMNMKIQLLNLKEVFSSLPIHDANMHIMKLWGSTLYIIYVWRGRKLYD